MGLQLVAGVSGSFALATRYGGGNAQIDLDAMADQTNPAGARGRIQVKSNGQIDLTGLGGSINLSGSGTIIQGLTYPGTDGTNGQVITTNGSGVLTFTSVSGSSINTGSFATTGSNTFTGDQTISKNGGVYNIIDNSNPSFGTASFGISGTSGGLVFKQSGSIVMEGSFPKNLTFYGTGSFVRGIKISDSDITQGATIIYNTTTNTFGMLDESGATSSLDLEGTFTASLAQGYAWVGNSSNRTTLVATSSFGGGTTYINPTLNPYSGSLILVANTFTSSSFAHISASANGQVNLVFKNNNNTADTIISGSGNMFINPAAPTAGFKRYVGGSGNIALNASNVPQRSGSMAFSPTMNNNYFGGNSTGLTMRGPVSSSTYTISANNVLGTINIGSSATLNAEKLTSGLTLTGNSIAGTLNIIANQSALTGSTTSLANNIIAATITLNLSSSAVAMSNNIINDSNFTFTNQFYTGSLGVGSVALNRNNIGGQGNSIIVSGSLPAGTTTIPSLSD